MKQKIYQVDAFAGQVFSGNPAAVCPLTEWLADTVLLKIAGENNLSETAFYVPKEDGFEIRWFTPTTEVDLCGHATLATAYVIRYEEGYEGEVIRFYSPRSGLLPVRVEGGRFVLNFPADQFSEVPMTDELLQATDKRPIRAFRGKSDYLLVFERQEDVVGLNPDLLQIAKIDARGIIVTAKGGRYDFVSRFFGPAVGVDEDPVTGSAHTTLIPYWAQQFDQNELTAYQYSERGGQVYCRFLGDRVEIGGAAVLYLKGEIYI